MQIRLYVSRRPVPKEGRLAIVTNAGRDAVDADGAQRRSALEADGESRCGPDAPTLAVKLAEDNSAGDGGKKATVTGEERDSKPLNQLRGECRVMENRCDRGDYTRMLILVCMRGCGRIERPAFPAPSHRGED